MPPIPRLLLALLAVCACAACQQERKPPPVLRIEVTEDYGVYRYNGNRIGEQDLRRELGYIAEENRRDITGNSRVRVVLIAPQGPYDRRAQDLAAYCRSIGIDSLYFQAQ